jgi:multiple sugar transport system permease protein
MATVAAGRARPRRAPGSAGAALRGAVYTVLVLWALLSLLPLYWLFTTSFQGFGLTMVFPPSLYPHPATLVNYGDVLVKASLRRGFLNSCLVVAAVTLSNVFFNTLAGYVLAKMQFPGRRVLFWGIVALLMLPWQVTLIPVYLLTVRLGLFDTYLGLILPGSVSAFGIFLMKQYLQTLPAELLDAARVDGASEFGIFWRIILPVARPGIAVLATFVFVAHWNDFLIPLLLTTSNEMRTLQVALSQLQVMGYTNWGMIMAGAALAAVPTVLVFLAFQRDVTTGITVGALKG